MYLYLKIILYTSFTLTTRLFHVTGVKINNLKAELTSSLNALIDDVEGLSTLEDNDYKQDNNPSFLNPDSGSRSFMGLKNETAKSSVKLSKRSSKPNYSILFITMNMTNNSLNEKSKGIEETKSLSINDGMFFLEDKKPITNVLFSNKSLEIRRTKFKMSSPSKSPYAVLLLANTSMPRRPMVCSGTLVAERYVLTAASCLKSMKIVSDIVILAGGRSITELNRKNDNIQKITSSKHFCHPNYTLIGDQAINDVAIVKAKYKFKMTTFVNVLGLSRKPWSGKGFVNCSVTGYGKVQLFHDDTRDYMRKTYSLRVKKPCKCFEEGNTSSWMYADPSGPGGVCSGDVGSGLVCGGRLVAVTTQPLIVYDLDSCDLRQPPQYYTECGSIYMIPIFDNIHPYLNWVNNYVKTNKSSKGSAIRNNFFIGTYITLLRLLK